MDTATITIPAYVNRAFIRNNRCFNFVYSTNVHRGSTLGQAKECAREPNCFGIPVRFRFCKSDMSSYFHDNQMTLLKTIIAKAIAEVPTDKPVIVLPKIGAGASRMREYAPKTWAWMQDELAKICYKNIKWDYNA